MLPPPFLASFPRKSSRGRAWNVGHQVRADLLERCLKDWLASSSGTSNPTYNITGTTATSNPILGQRSSRGSTSAANTPGTITEKALMRVPTANAAGVTFTLNACPSYGR